MAKLADVQRVRNPSATKPPGPAARAGRAAGETLGPHGHPARETHLRGSGRPPPCQRLPCGRLALEHLPCFYAFLVHRWKLPLLHLAWLKRTVQLARLFTPFITEVCSDYLMKITDNDQPWQATAPSIFTSRKHTGASHPTPRRIMKHILHTVYFLSSISYDPQS